MTGASASRYASARPVPPFTAEQSAEIDRRIVEMIVAIWGQGHYAEVCQRIADDRARAIAAADFRVVLPALAVTFPLDALRRAKPRGVHRLLRAGALAVPAMLVIALWRRA